MDWNEIMTFIKPELAILVVFVYCVGLFLKKAPEFKQEWLIPFISLAIGIVITILYLALILNEGFNANVIISGIIQGVLIAAVAVFGNELIKQGFINRKIDNSKH